LKVLLLSRAEVEKLISMREVIEAVEEAFRAKGLGKVQMPPKTYVFFDRYQGDFRVMPTYMEGLDAWRGGCKIFGAERFSHHRNGGGRETGLYATNRLERDIQYQ